MFVPDKASIITDHEVRLLEELTTARQTTWCNKLTSHGITTNTRWWFIVAHNYTSLHRWVILALGNYYVLMCSCNNRHSSLILTFLFMPQIFTLFFSAHTSNPKHWVKSLLHFLYPNHRQLSHRLTIFEKMSPSLRILCKRQTTEATSQANPCPQMDAANHRILQCLHLPDLSQT